jgi:phosphopantetheinyl transferase
VTDSAITGDAIYLRDNKVWAIARSWANQRIGMTQAVWDAVTHPDESTLAIEFAPGVFIYNDTRANHHSRFSLSLRYLTASEKARYSAMKMPKQQIDHLNARIALKDGLRMLMRVDNQPYGYPILFDTVYDENGKPRITRLDGADTQSNPEISLAHKDGCGIAAIADRAVGVDIERIEPMDKGVWELAFTDAEKALLRQFDDTDEWAMRFWVAKEAYSKMIGHGLSGNPRRYAVDGVDGETLHIGDTAVITKRYGDTHIIGWTDFARPEGVCIDK